MIAPYLDLRWSLRPRLPWRLAGLSSFVVGTCLSVTAYAADCSHLASLRMEHASITNAELVSGGTFTRAGKAPITHLPDFCRVAATLRPTQHSEIRIEVWMPETHWNGRIEGTGNGGFAGAIAYDSLASGLRLGYAVANTDMGMSTPPGSDASIFAKRPERWADWGYRSTHEMTIATRRLVKAYYARDARKAYFVGCSTGGEQALMEAQRFPDDYDGIVGGAPANDRTGVHMSLLWTFAALQRTPESYLPPEKAAMLGKAVLHACDALDGVTDGLIVDPQRCSFDPGVLLCKEGAAEYCLTAPQVEAARAVYAGPVDPRTSRSLYPGLARGSELAWDRTFLAPSQAKAPPYAPIFEWVFGTDWNWRSFDFGADSDTFARKLGSSVNATSPDLDAFRTHGHKLLMYHGWSDPVVAPGDSIVYYHSVLRRDEEARAGRHAKAKDGSSSPAPIADSYRLFMVPGMEHCGGGPGPSDFSPLDAVVQWVEQGVAPETLIAQKMLAGDTGKQTTMMQRLLCPYPRTARYQGSGDVDAAASYTCAE